MHLFPPAYAGLHPAFPPLHEFQTGHPVLTLAVIPGAALLLPFSPFAVSWRAANRIAAYGLAATSTLGYRYRRLADDRARAFLEDQHIKIPRSRIFDRAGQVDMDDFMLVGIVVLLGATRRGPLHVTGWHRWPAVAAYGCFAGCLTSMSTGVITMGIDPLKRAEMKRVKERLSEAETWRFAVNLAWYKPKHEAQTSPTGPGNAVPVVGSIQDHIRHIPASLERLRLHVPPEDKIGAGMESWPNLSNEPHLTTEFCQSADVGPKPYPSTNYRWTPAEPAQAIPELESHLSELRQWRQILATEAEYLWHWVAHKEAEYYNMDSESAPAGTKLKLRRYLETLGGAQAKLCMEVSKVDWMIADSEKQIKQLRSAESDGRVCWVPPLPPTTSAPRLQASLAILKHQQQEIWGRRTLVEQLNAQMAYAQLHQAHATVLDQKLWQQPETGEWQSMRVFVDELTKRGNLASENLTLDAEVMEQVVSDVQNRVDAESPSDR